MGEKFFLYFKENQGTVIEGGKTKNPWLIIESCPNCESRNILGKVYDEWLADALVCLLNKGLPGKLEHE